MSLVTQWLFGVLYFFAMSQGQILVWGWKPSTQAAEALPRGANFVMFSLSLKLVEIPLSQGACAKGVEYVGIAVPSSFPDMSLEAEPILCRNDHGVYRSALKKVPLKNIYDAASSQEPTPVRELLSVSGCESFIEACIVLAEIVKPGLPRDRALTAAVTSLREALAIRRDGFGPALLTNIKDFLSRANRGLVPPLPDFAGWMTGMVSERLNLRPGLAGPEVRSQSAVMALIGDLHWRLGKHLLQATGGGHFVASVSEGGKKALSDELHVLGPHPEDLCTKVVLVVRKREIWPNMPALELVSRCSVCVTSGIGGVEGSRTVRISPRGFFVDGDIIVAFVLQDVHEYLYAYNCLRRFSFCYPSESEDLQGISWIFAQSVAPSAQSSVEASPAFRAYMGLSVDGDSPGLQRIFGIAGQRTEFLDFVRVILHPDVLSYEQEAFLQCFKKPISWLDGPPGSGKGVMMAVCLTWCARKADCSQNVFTVACVDTRRMADDLCATIGRYMVKGREKGIVGSACDFARLGRADDRDDWGGHWDTFLEKEFQTRLAEELSLLKQLDTRVEAAQALYMSLLRAGMSCCQEWNQFQDLHVLRERFVREVVYPAEHRVLVSVMAEVPGIVVTNSLLRKLLGGDPREVPSQIQRDFGSLRHWTQVMRSGRGALLWIDEHEGESPQTLAPVLLHFDDVVLSGGGSQTMNLHCDDVEEVRGNTILSLVKSAVSSLSGLSGSLIQTRFTDMLRYEMSSDWCERNPCVQKFRLRKTHRYSACICELLTQALQRDYISMAKTDTRLYRVFLGRLADVKVNEKAEVCFSPRLVAALLRVLVHASGYASSVLVVGFYADFVGRVESAVRALLPYVLPAGFDEYGFKVSFATPKNARGGEFDVAVVLAIKKDAQANCWTGRHFLDLGCIEVALTRGIKGTYVLMDDVSKPDGTWQSLLKKQLVWWNVREYLLRRCEDLFEAVECKGLPEAVESELVHLGALGVESPATLSLAASFSWGAIRDLVECEHDYRECSNLARREFDAAKAVRRDPANLRSYLLDAVFVRRECLSKFTVSVPTLCWYALPNDRDPHHLACDLWQRVEHLCSDEGIDCRKQVLRHKKALKFIGCHEVLEVNAHSDRWGYELSRGASDDGGGEYLYIYPCMGLARQHVYVTSLLVKSNSIFFVRKVCWVLSSQMGCKLDLIADPDRVLWEHGVPSRSVVTMDSVREAL